MKTNEKVGKWIMIFGMNELNFFTIVKEKNDDWTKKNKTTSLCIPWIIENLIIQISGV